MRKVKAIGAVAAAMALTAVGCSGGSSGSDGATDTVEPTTTLAGEPGPGSIPPASVPDPIQPTYSVALTDRVAGAIDAGVVFAAAQIDQVDPVSLAYYDYLWRNWEAPGLDTARAKAQAAELPDDPQFTILARLIDPSAPLEPRPAGDAVSDLEYEVLARALHCDQEPLPDDWAQTVREQISGQVGPVVLNHVAYAVGWVRELGCPVAGIEELAEEVVGSLVNVDGGFTTVDDDGLQAGVGLVYLGRADLVSEAWITQLADAQLADGGWPEQVGAQESSWHTTGLALWTLYGVQSAGTGAPMLVTE